VKLRRTLLFALLAVCSCAFTTESPRLVVRPELGESYTVGVPCKAHLRDGAVLLCDTGISVRHDTAFCSGVRYDLVRDSAVRADAVPLESIAGVEYYETSTNSCICLAGVPAICAVVTLLAFAFGRHP
jgi:hypothetical protein